MPVPGKRSSTVPAAQRREVLRLGAYSSWDNAGLYNLIKPIWQALSTAFAMFLAPSVR